MGALPAPPARGAGASRGRAAALPVLETPRLRLRPRMPDDLEDCVAMDREPGTLDWIDWPEATGSWDDAAAHRAFVRARIGAAYPPGMGYWVMATREDPGGFLGWVLLIPENAQGPDTEIGWRLRTAARGRGYATEAARAVLAHGFDTIGLDRVVAEMYRANAASMGVARKLGMRQRPDPRRTTDRFVLWELRREDWRRDRPRDRRR